MVRFCLDQTWVVFLFLFFFFLTSQKPEPWWTDRLNTEAHWTLWWSLWWSFRTDILTPTNLAISKTNKIRISEENTEKDSNESDRPWFITPGIWHARRLQPCECTPVRQEDSVFGPKLAQNGEQNITKPWPLMNCPRNKKTSACSYIFNLHHIFLM